MSERGEKSFEPADYPQTEEAVPVRPIESFVALSDVVAQLKEAGGDVQHAAGELFDAAEMFHTLSQDRNDSAMHEYRLRIVDAILTGKGVASVFPQHDLSAATCRLLEVCVSSEVGKGLELQAYGDRLASQEYCAARMAETAFRIGQRDASKAFFAFARLTFPQQQAFICRLDGKTPAEAGVILRKNNIQVKLEQAYKIMTAAGYSKEVLFPPPDFNHRRAQSSILKNLHTYLPIIDEDCRDLSRRLTGVDFDTIAHSLFAIGFGADRAAIVLRNFTAPQGFNPPSRQLGNEHLRSRVVRKYNQKFATLTKIYKPRSLPRVPKVLPKNLEESDEVQKTILEVLAFEASMKGLTSAEREIANPTLTAEEERELALRIEAGMWAEARLELAGGEQRRAKATEYISDRTQGFNPEELPESPLSQEDLELFAIDGREAFIRFMKANLGLATILSDVTRYDAAQLRTRLEKMIAGMEGVTRALRSFDYRTGYKFSTYARDWIRNRTQVHRWRSYPGIPRTVVADWEKISIRHARLIQVRQTEEISLAQLTETTGLTDKRIRYVLGMMGSQGIVSEYIYGDRLLAIASPESPPTPSRFTEKTQTLLEKLFAGEPSNLQCLRLYFEEEYDIQRISKEMHITPQEASERLNEALSLLHHHLEPSRNLGVAE